MKSSLKRCRRDSSDPGITSEGSCTKLMLSAKLSPRNDTESVCCSGAVGLSESYAARFAMKRYTLLSAALYMGRVRKFTWFTAWYSSLASSPTASPLLSSAAVTALSSKV